METANEFFDLVGSSLKQCGFSRDHNFEGYVIFHGGKCARFRAESNLCLNAGFSVLDGNYASVTFGRLWRDGTGWEMLSNYYFVFARHMGFEVPESYTLGYQDQILDTARRIASDLERTLPTICARLTLGDLEQIEAQQYGARLMATLQHGDNVDDVVTVSDFLPAR